MLWCGLADRFILTRGIAVFKTNRFSVFNCIAGSVELAPISTRWVFRARVRDREKHSSYNV